MEDARTIHKERTSRWLSVVIDLATRLNGRSDAKSSDLVVTPWSGRSPRGWSA